MTVLFKKKLPFNKGCCMIKLMKTFALTLFMMLVTGSAPIMPSIPANAFLLDEAELFTYDQKCRINYLTDKNTKGWYITTSSENCPNGLLNGYAEVTVYDAFSRPSEQIYGYFTNGYWTGDIDLKQRSLKRSSEEYGIQKAVFEITRDTSSNITYIGQMTSRRNARDVYTSFEICDPFRVLAVTPHMALFKNPHATQAILDDVITYTREICPAEKRILFFSATTDHPLPRDIVFYADINLETGKTYIKRNKALHPDVSDKEIADAGSGGEDIAVATDLKGAVGSPVSAGVRLETDKILKKDKKHSLSNSINEYELEKKSVEPPLTVDELIDAVVDESDNRSKSKDSVQENIDQIKTHQSDVTQKKTVVGMDTIAHLRLMSQVNQKPVFGTVIVYVDRLNDMGGITDTPSRLTLQGENIITGWGVVSGYFSFDRLDHKYSGVVQVTSFIPCATHQCKDIQ